MENGYQNSALFLSPCTVTTTTAEETTVWMMLLYAFFRFPLHTFFLSFDARFVTKNE